MAKAKPKEPDFLTAIPPADAVRHRLAVEEEGARQLRILLELAERLEEAGFEAEGRVSIDVRLWLEPGMVAWLRNNSIDHGLSADRAIQRIVESADLDDAIGPGYRGGL